jgi:LysM repeat protein
MTKRTLIVLVVAAVLAPRLAEAGAEKAGTTAANFLTVGGGPSALAMGGASLGLANGLDAASLNVGALGWIDGNSFTLSHASLDDQSKQEWASFGGMVGGLGTRWGVSGLYQSDGTFEGRDAGNNPTGTFDVSSMAVGLQLAQAFTDKLSVGLGTKWVSDKLGDATTGSGFTFDAGMSMRMGWVGLGFAAQNAFGKMRYDGVPYDFPTNYGIGIGVTHPTTGITAALDINMPSAYYKNVRGGVEWMYRQNLALRMGYRYDVGASDVDALDGPTFGVGAGANGFWFDYGYLIAGNQGGQHRLALSFRPGSTPREESSGWSSTARSLQASPPPAPKPKHEPESIAPPAKSKPSSESVPARKPVSDEASSLPEVPAKTSAPPKSSAPASSAAPKSGVSPQSSSVGAPMPSTPAPITSPPPTPTSTGRHAVEMAKGAAAAAPSAPAAPAPAPSSPPPSSAIVAPPKPAAPADAAKSAPAPETKSAPSSESAAPSTTPAAKPAPAKVEAPAPQAPAKSAQRPATVTVKKGETLDDIARQWGTSAAAIMMENNLVRDKLRPGQVLKLPRK